MSTKVLLVQTKANNKRLKYGIQHWVFIPSAKIVAKKLTTSNQSMVFLVEVTHYMSSWVANIGNDVTVFKCLDTQTTNFAC